MTSNKNIRNVWAACSELILDNKRITVRKVAEMVGLSKTPIWQHLERLESAGYITKGRGSHTSRADWVVNIPLITMGREKERNESQTL